MNTTSETVSRGPLDVDAARFLHTFGAALALPGSGVDTEHGIAAYLAGERARLNDTPGASLLRPNARRVAVQDHRTSDGVEVRSYVPEGAADQRPIVVYLHGGGFVSGSINLNDSTCRILAAEGDLVVVSVGYRLAPENPYPVPLDDSDSALRWAQHMAQELFGADPSRLAVAGGSSGGALAAALALRSRDRGEPEIALQVLIYPVLDSQMAGASYSQCCSVKPEMVMSTRVPAFLLSN
jgi:acetyl esterase